MDQSTGQSAPTPGRREMMYCHECNDEWYRDERGIICPECGSEFTEIIEDDNDPRDNAAFDHGPDDDDDSMRSIEDNPSHHPLHDHNPWQEADDPEEADISAMRFQPISPGRFHVQATIHRTISPAQFGNPGNGPNTIGGFTSFLTNLLQGAQQGQQQHPASPGQGQDNAESRSGQDGQPHVHRFTYTAGARLQPRDANNPGPRLEPVDDINNVMAGLFAALGDPAGARNGGPGRTPFNDPTGANPLMNLFAAMSGGVHGDAVYSQEALDQIVTQLMEQTATSNAPGPASQDDIDRLTRRRISEEMLGAEGRAECSICMDEVNIGQEVTELPCKHWFHHQCVSAWLGEHDTCPHCRKGIAKSGEGPRHESSSAAAATPGADPTASMPGAFGVSGHGTEGNPYIVPRAGSDDADTASNAAQFQGSGNEGASSGSGGISERFRRGLFGPQ